MVSMYNIIPITFLAHFCPRRTVFVGDYEVAVIRSLSVRSFVPLCQTLLYFLNQASEVPETLPVLFLCQWELVY